MDGNNFPSESRGNFTLPQQAKAINSNPGHRALIDADDCVNCAYMSEISATQRLGTQAQATLARLVGKPLFWLIFIGVAVALPIARAVQIRLPPALPLLSKVPPFQLTDQYGNRFDSASLNGKIWVANFIFTRCPTICPLFTEKMYKIQHRGRGLGDALHLVSFTVDPEYDTPEKLLEYANHHRASPRAWSFLTGPRPVLTEVVVRDLKVQMTKEGPDDDLMSIGHGGHFVLVDGSMRVRGYYDSSRPDAVDSVLRDAGLLANRGY